jgi:hypothetical protein
MKAGPSLLAQLTGRPLLPISFEFSRAWPCGAGIGSSFQNHSRASHFRVGALHTVDRTASEADFESARRRGEDLLMAITRER